MRGVVFNLGCKVNRYESDVLAEKLSECGFDMAERLVPADFYVINTCAVTAEAERKSRQCVTRCRKLNPFAGIYVVGCASQKCASSFLKNGVRYIGGTAGKAEVVERIKDEIIQKDTKIVIKPLPARYEEYGLRSAPRSRALLKIQDGCNDFCSYCIVPYLRGRSRSRAVANIAAEAKILQKTACEIILTGINLARYGLDAGQNLTKLIRGLSDIEARIRLSSFSAEGLTRELLDALFGLKNFCPHFHLSLQSGDDSVLKAMNRRYAAEDVAEKIVLIREYDRYSGITADIICGYPTETEENHKNTVEFIRAAKFSDIHVFPFSARPGTRAYALEPIEKTIVDRRRSDLLRLKEELRKNFAAKNIGVRQEVLIEENIGGYGVGYSKNYLRIYTKKHGEIVDVVPTDFYGDGLKED